MSTNDNRTVYSTDFFTAPAVDADGVPVCRNCGSVMRWDAYTCARRPDALRRRDERAPIEWAWHCRCGQWSYGTDPRGGQV
jgi:hypothetical protein